MGNQLLSSLLPRNRGFELVGDAVNTTELLEAVSGGCDVVVASSNLEREGGGIAVTRRLRDLQGGIKVVLLLDELGREAVVAAFRAGAKGVVGRTQSLDLLWKCIVCVQAGQIWASSRELHFLLETLQQSMEARFASVDTISLLSEQERKVVRHVCEGLSNREIAQRMGLSEHTIKNHLFRIFSRLGVSSRVEIMFSVLSQRAPEVAEKPASGATGTEIAGATS